MVRPLTAADTLDARALLRARPLHNVFLDYVVAAGVLGRVPGFYGFVPDGRLEAILMIGPQGGTALEVRDARAFAPLAAAAARCALRPRHIVGSEDVTEPFWRAYEPHARGLRWSRGEPVFAVREAELCAAPSNGPRARLEVARAADAAEVIANSAEQHREDLHDDREAADPAGFRERHESDVRDGRWWIARERGRIVFQVHVGASSAQAIQLGGVFVPRDVRGRGHATARVREICARLLERNEIVTLYCDEANERARRVYERVGFREVFRNRSYLLEESSSPEKLVGYG
ncbi:MAG: GNAT family N-acetyltransferase [Myxococcota bacterium]